MSEIVIKSPDVYNDGDKAILEIPFLCNGKEYAFINKYSSICADYISKDRVDSAVVALLRVAMLKGFNIVSDIPISEELYYNLQYCYIDMLHAANLETTRIGLKMPTISIANNKSEQKIIATGISCGVDSLYTVSTHQNCKEHSLNTLMYFDVGAHLTSELAQQRKQLAIDFSKDIGLPLITIESNMPEIVSEIEGTPYYHILSHTFMMGALILSLQSIMKYYYYSSTYTLEKLSLSFMDDCAKYDLLTLNALSINGVRLFSSGINEHRIDKVKRLSEFPLSYRYLNVCIANIHNDMVCFKCIRTLLELDAVGTLDKYSSVFDVDFYRKNKKYYLYRLFYTSQIKKDYLMQEIYPYFKEKMTFWFKIKALWHLSWNRLLKKKQL